MSTAVSPPRRSDPDRPLRIALVAGTRFPVGQPFAGGLEAHTWQLATGLLARGHRVTVIAAEGSDPALRARRFAGGRPALSPSARSDVTAGPETVMWDHHAYLSTMLELSRSTEFDVVHNNSVHHMPLAMSPALATPQVTTLHTPPTLWMELAISGSPEPLPVRFCAVSRHTAEAWRALAPAAVVIANAIDLDAWSPGPGGPDAVWTGRIVPEKGLHLAIDAARSVGRRLTFAGPRLDPGYWDAEIGPRLGPDVRWAGHLCQDELHRLVAAAAVAVVTPCWDEPFGLVALEALACGTPVAAIGRGGLTEIVDGTSGVLVSGEDPVALGAAIEGAALLDRGDARARAEAIGSADRMLDEYVALYRSCLS